ncbi:hypothetical protein [Faecalibacterium prausnitzii]|uniref:Lipoprotein n=1 Tax=Faecalibacterium prausnitzii TaxID=853 RepID=A0A564SQ78_9FIRM|nr:hypothetical protein [Faecalibacterium prausnitzii]VUW97211.1 Uncharacterised protein [Faecalibacterium prausnitzii]
MKMAKKFLAVALAGVLALSVLTGCANGVKSKDVAKALTKMGINAEQDKDMDKAAKETLKAIEAIIDAKANADLKDDNADKIKLSNAVVKADGKVIKENNFVGSVDNVKKALGVFATGSDAEKANVGKQVRVALVEIKNAKKDASLQAALVKDALVEAQAATVANTTTHKVAETGKLGTATTKDGKYILVVIVNDVVAKNA